jgi:hypothetical protein
MLREVSALVIPGRRTVCGESGIHTPQRDHGFRVRELRSRPGMTAEYEAQDG